jgi:hypothetical protein
MRFDVIARSEAIHSFFLPPYGLLRGASHRARIRATRWLAMTVLGQRLRFIPHCSNATKRPLLKGQWHFGRLVYIGALEIGLRGRAPRALVKITREKTCVN